MQAPDERSMSAFKKDRNIAWGVTWLAYATYYTGRLGFSVSKKSIRDELGLSEAELGLIDSFYSGAYSLGQFASGLLGDRIGARRLIGYGMLLSAACSAAFGASRAFVLFAILFTINGFAQSTGWPGTTRAMSEWTLRRNRGTVMAFWATCYQVGPLGATYLAGVLLGAFGWRATFYGPTLLLSLVAVLVLVLLKTGPSEDASEAERKVEAPAIEPSAQAVRRRKAQLAILKSPVLWCYGTSYFFVKFIRYTLLFWLPYYLSQQLGYDGKQAAFVSTAFLWGGIFGSIVIGVVSDWLPRFSRSFIAVPWLFALGVILSSNTFIGATSAWGNVILLGLIGVTLFGPDSLISGAAAQDAGGPHAASTATGFVNGIGSIGQILVGFVVPYISARFGWSALFPALGGMALLAGITLLPALKYKTFVR
jgi:sugar phosphate permease